MNCPICPRQRLELVGELGGYLVIGCPKCRVRRRADPLEVLVLGSDPMGFDPDDTGQHLHQVDLDRLERRESTLLEALRLIRLELPAVQDQIRALYNAPKEATAC